MNGSNRENRIVKGIVCYRNDDGSFSDDIDEIYCDESEAEELTEYEKTKLTYFAEKVLAPMFIKYVRTLEERRNAPSNR